MTQLPNYWSLVEQQWRDYHLDSLLPHLNLTVKTQDWVATIAMHPDIVNGSNNSKLNVSRLLLRRLGEELRGVELLAANGHGFQAATAACNLFEQSHYLTYVGMDAANADAFVQWTDPYTSPISVRQLVNQSGKARSWPQLRCDEEYEKYRFLCGFKHNNPVFQGILQLRTDPDAYLSQYALAESAWCILSAVGLFAMLHLKPENTVAVLEQCNGLMDLAPPLFPKIDTRQNTGL